MSGRKIRLELGEKRGTEYVPFRLVRFVLKHLFPPDREIRTSSISRQRKLRASIKIGEMIGCGGRKIRAFVFRNETLSAQ